MDDLVLSDQPVFERAFAQLMTADPRLSPLAEATGMPGRRRRPADFEGLAGLVVAQQLSVAAARAITARLEQELGGPPTAAAMLAASAEALRRAGLSTPKVRALLGMARMLEAGQVDLEAIAALPSEDAMAELVRLPGVGRWTADLYLLFCLGRADAFPSGDLALQVAAGLALGAGVRATAQELLIMAEQWRPWRGVAAHLLWAYYGLKRRRAGAPA